MNTLYKFFFLALALATILSACAGAAQNESAGKIVKYTLTTGLVDGNMSFIGVGGGIDAARGCDVVPSGRA
jgi:uncharacterized membrane protein